MESDMGKQVELNLYCQVTQRGLALLYCNNYMMYLYIIQIRNILLTANQSFLTG